MTNYHSYPIAQLNKKEKEQENKRNTLYLKPTHFSYYECFQIAAIISSCLKKKTLPFERWNNKYAQAHNTTMSLYTTIKLYLFCLFPTTTLYTNLYLKLI